MKRFYTRLFTHPIHMYLLLLIAMIFTRLAITYLDPSGRIRMPEWSFAYETLGRDDKFSADAAFKIRAGKPGYIFGYSSILVSTVFAETLESVGICRPSNITLCEIRMYHMLVVITIVGLLCLLYLAIPHNRDRELALAFFGIFLLGVPMNKAIEAGNIDLLAVLVIGIAWLLFRKVVEGKNHAMIFSIFLGLLLGFLSNVKAFTILFAIIPLMLSPKNPVLWASFVVGFAGSALWPHLYGIQSGIFDVFIAAQGFSKDYSGGLGLHPVTQINYGNNSVLAYVSNVLSWVHLGKITPSIHTTLTRIISGIVMTLILVKPLYDEKLLNSAALRYIKTHLSILSTFSFSLVLYALTYIAINTLTIWSYDYRMLYGLPLVFFLIASPENKKTKLLLHLCVVFMLVKSLWIPKDRLMTMFFYIHMYYLFRASLSVWKHRQMPHRFV